MHHNTALLLGDHWSYENSWERNIFIQPPQIREELWAENSGSIADPGAVFAHRLLYLTPCPSLGN